ncbi:putative peptidyl-prolyl isomerase [Monocercomonoides exilis]|uniref:putative peptidyl-prolyl isomerase n=1 Tax=Monocercomonoides exilis TaxID=2049356 RepID=UPI00355A6205|nr:putative peptidyl-prolyl isomerase [Monocercomonoides exilis]|eukprot:MONOS_14916.1-p1 / transcript=MONOS_14916.1 / gene=MONOS_14916 / organism=Monocercomonoides_exilis_PA203 / gene_product=peptidyl-prolyl isomerase, putative / transcript_product=peptidyl-prolyl isomerase, putative / location=Mono_scaffold01104:13030-14394(-) / protein_length=454 / sequence_SO=supercontig / SO=protein_coding / is_pseudo=false
MSEDEYESPSTATDYDADETTATMTTIFDTNDESSESNDEYKDPEPHLLDDGTYDILPLLSGKLVKRIIKEGTGISPQKHSNLKVLFTGKLEDGTVFDENQDINSPFKFRLGEGDVIKGWDIGVATMKVGEISEFKVSSLLAYGKEGKPPKIPGDSTLIFTIELLSCILKPKHTLDQIAKATELKEEGAKFVKEGKWDKATEIYKLGLTYVWTAFKAKNSIREQILPLKLAYHLNMSLCYLKVSPPLPQKALREANNAVKIDGNSAKAHFRRGMAKRGCCDLDGAKADFEAAKLLAPDDKSILREIEYTNALIRIQNEKEKKMFGGVFERMAMEEKKEKEERRKKRKEEKEKQREQRRKERAEKRKARLEKGEESDDSAESSFENEKKERRQHRRLRRARKEKAKDISEEALKTDEDAISSEKREENKEKSESSKEAIAEDPSQSTGDIHEKAC